VKRSHSKRKTVGIVTEGRGEVVALPLLYSQLEKVGSVRLINPIFADVDPLAPIALLCKGLSPRIKQAGSRGADRVIVLLDSEKNNICPGERAAEICRCLSGMVEEEVAIVLKHTCFENWLVADMSPFFAQPALFPEVARMKISAGSADVANGKRVIQSALGSRRFYSKMDHPCKILKGANVEAMRRQSRSFDKFVRTLAV
jgi:hypothetical protein